MAKLLKLKNLNNIILLLLLLVSCNDDKKNKYVIHKYDDGTYLKSNYFLENNDTVLNGKCSIFYSNNKLKISSELYRNEINGKVNYYGIDGLLDSIKYIVNNKEIGETYWYHKNGNIFKYNFYDDLNNLNFYAIYDTLGNLENCNGLILLEVNQFKLKKNNKPQFYKIGDKVKYKFMLPNIPNTTQDFKFELIGYDNKKIKRKIKKIEPTSIEVEDIAVMKGNNTIKAYAKYMFKDKNKIILSDTISFQFFVK